MKNLSNRADRILNELKTQNRTYGDVARALNISPTSVYKWIRKDGQMSPNHLIKLASFLKTTPEWIQFGTTPVKGIDPSTTRVMQALQMLDHNDRLAVEEMVRVYVNVKLRPQTLVTPKPACAPATMQSTKEDSP